MVPLIKVTILSVVRTKILEECPKDIVDSSPTGVAPGVPEGLMWHVRGTEIRDPERETAEERDEVGVVAGMTRIFTVRPRTGSRKNLK